MRGGCSEGVKRGREMSEGGRGGGVEGEGWRCECSVIYLQYSIIVVLYIVD